MMQCADEVNLHTEKTVIVAKGWSWENRYGGKYDEFRGWEFRIYLCLDDGNGHRIIHLFVSED